MERRIKHKYFSRSRISLASLLLVCFSSLHCLKAYAAENQAVAVIYPEIREPYLSVFKEIKSGIDQALISPAETIIINRKTNPESLDAQLDSANIDAVITLGSGAYHFAEQLSTERNVIGGAVFTRPDDSENPVPSISMIVAPKAQFVQLRKIAPQVKTIHVIYNAEQDQWLIDKAQLALKDSGISLAAVATDELKDQALSYQQLLEGRKLGNNDALWLLQGDRVSNENAILSQILKKAWEQGFVVFSANPSHVKRGALFATYPHNTLLGERLGHALLAGTDEQRPDVMPLSDVRVAFNRRTAEHLELNITRVQKASFDLIFPNR